MPTLKLYIRCKAADPNKIVPIRVKLGVSRTIILRAKTNVLIPQMYWDAKREDLKNRVILPANLDREKISRYLQELKAGVLRALENTSLEKLSDEWLAQQIKAPTSDRGKAPAVLSFLQLYERYLDSQTALSPGRIRQLRVAYRMVERYVAITKVRLNVHTFGPDHLRRFEEFLIQEHEIQELHPEFYKDVRMQKQRGRNTLVSKLKMVKAFMAWAYDNKHTTNNALAGYELQEEVYADPVVLDFAEVKALKDADLPEHLRLSRDLFILQCYLGCRVGDFWQLTKANINDGYLMYIAEKTIEDNSKTVYVPLLPDALEIIERYGYPDGKLMPFKDVYGRSGYNTQIKEIFRIAGLTRSVVVLDSVTSKPVTKPLNEVASTHLARRTFINANYKQTQDPALISLMTGHSKGSRAFERYRNIDLDMLREQVKKSLQ